VEFLIALSAELQDESFSLNFDYLSMHMRCLEFLKEVYVNNQEYFNGKFDGGKVDESKLPLLTQNSDDNQRRGPYSCPRDI
jgi:hypothetical protein